VWCRCYTYTVYILEAGRARDRGVKKLIGLDTFTFVSKHFFVEFMGIDFAVLTSYVFQMREMRSLVRQ
jgi:hypothetical protein